MSARSLGDDDPQDDVGDLARADDPEDQEEEPYERPAGPEAVGEGGAHTGDHAPFTSTRADERSHADAPTRRPDGLNTAPRPASPIWARRAPGAPRTAWGKLSAVRTKPIVGDKLWFGPRRDRLGWGWSPVSWEGWVTVVVAVVAIVGLSWRAETQAAPPFPTLLWILGITAALLGACALKGTTPGGRKKAEELRRLTDR